MNTEAEEEPAEAENISCYMCSTWKFKEVFEVIN